MSPQCEKEHKNKAKIHHITDYSNFLPIIIADCHYAIITFTLPCSQQSLLTHNTRRRHIEHSTNDQIVLFLQLIIDTKSTSNE